MRRHSMRLDRGSSWVHHVARERSEIRDSQRAAEGCETLGKRNIQAIECVGAQPLRMFADFLGIERRCRLQAGNSEEGFVLAIVDH